MMFDFNYLDTTPSQLKVLIIDSRKALNESSSRVMRLCGYQCALFRIVFSEFNAVLKRLCFHHIGKKMEGFRYVVMNFEQQISIRTRLKVQFLDQKLPK